MNNTWYTYLGNDEFVAVPSPISSLSATDDAEFVCHNCMLMDIGFEQHLTFGATSAPISTEVYCRETEGGKDFLLVTLSSEGILGHVMCQGFPMFLSYFRT